MSERSPTPWTYEEAFELNDYSGNGALPINIRSGDDWIVAAVVGDVPELPAEANAALICRAVNCHDEMVEALKMADRLLGQFAGPGWSEWAEAQVVRSALSKACPAKEGDE